MIKKTYLFLISLTISLVVVAQPFQKITGIPVLQNGAPLQMPWAGGLNAPIFNTIDLNSDGIKDLVLFEKQTFANYPGSHRLSTFINAGIPNQVEYMYAPQYITQFPGNLRDWMLLVDVNCDNLEDIISYNPLGGASIQLNNGSNNFSMAYPLLYGTYLGGSFGFISISNINQAVFKDVDIDGDIDLLNFEVTGGNIEYFQNMGLENFGRCDTLVLLQQKACWGHVELSSFSNTVSLNACSNIVSDSANAFRKLHAGSCMIGFDNAADGDLDILNGDILGNNILYLENAGIPGTDDLITYQDTVFPSYDSPVNYRTFPAPYLVDVDNDNDHDLIISSCLELQSESYNNILFYQNTTNDTSNIFQYTEKRFLANRMVDVGAGANVAFLDVDADGLQDMLIANFGVFDSINLNTDYISSIHYYRNTGSITCPEFSLVNDNFANLFSLGLVNLMPAFGDLDADGDLDMVCGEVDGNLFYFTNTAGAGNPVSFTLAPNGIQWQGIDVGYTAAPQIVDVDLDGLPDLVIGNAFGKIDYYRNTGTTTVPVLTLQTNFFGSVNVSNTAAGGFFGYATPHLFNNNGVWNLLVGSEQGNLFLYDNISGNLSGAFNLVTDSAFYIIEHYRSSIARTDLNSDGLPEILIGCFAGGVGMYSQSMPCITGIASAASTPISFNAYPNPANSILFIDFPLNTNTTKNISVLDVLGKQVFAAKSLQQKNKINIAHLPQGVYFIQITDNNTLLTKKIIKQ